MFNSVTNTCDKTEVEEYISSEVDVESLNVCVSEIVVPIKYVPHNKSPGHDSLISEPVLLAVLFKLMLQHGYLPDSLMLDMLVHILKSRTGDITEPSVILGVLLNMFFSWFSQYMPIIL